jgi:hypothetical protein
MKSIDSKQSAHVLSRRLSKAVIAQGGCNEELPTIKMEHSNKNIRGLNNNQDIICIEENGENFDANNLFQSYEPMHGGFFKARRSSYLARRNIS